MALTLGPCKPLKTTGGSRGSKLTHCGPQPAKGYYRIFGTPDLGVDVPANCDTAPWSNAYPRATMSRGLGIRRMVPYLRLQIKIRVGAKSAAHWTTQFDGARHTKHLHIFGSLNLTTVALVDCNSAILAIYNPVQVGHDSPF